MSALVERFTLSHSAVPVPFDQSTPGAAVRRARTIATDGGAALRHGNRPCQLGRVVWVGHQPPCLSLGSGVDGDTRHFLCATGRPLTTSAQHEAAAHGRVGERSDHASRFDSCLPSFHSPRLGRPAQRLVCRPLRRQRTSDQTAAGSVAPTLAPREGSRYRVSEGARRQGAGT